MRSDRVCNRKIGIARLTPGDAFIPTRSLSLPSRPYRESGQALVSFGNSARFADAAITFRDAGLCSSPLSTYVAQGTFALTATHRRDCGRRSGPQTRSTSRTIGLPSAPVCSRPAPCQRTDARTSRAKGGSGQETVPVAAGSVNRHRLLQVLSLPASQGRCNKRPGSVFPPHHRRCQESAS